MGTSSIHSNSELYNRSGASFYTMPEADQEALLKENQELESEIYELESQMSADPEFRETLKSVSDVDS